MAKRIFFSFHYQDVIDFRANVVRNHWRYKDDREAAGFFDASLWESSRRTGDQALKRLINEGLKNTSITVVLIGQHTYARRWVRYEIMKRKMETEGLWANIHAKRKRGERMRKKGEKGAPTADALRSAQKSEDLATGGTTTASIPNPAQTAMGPRLKTVTMHDKRRKKDKFPVLLKRFRKYIEDNHG